LSAAKQAYPARQTQFETITAAAKGCDVIVGAATAVRSDGAQAAAQRLITAARGSMDTVLPLW
jgi:hypothetical protein